jgi:hypothetical protein
MTGVDKLTEGTRVTVQLDDEQTAGQSRGKKK